MLASCFAGSRGDVEPQVFFLRMEHAWEAKVSRRVTKLENELDSTHRESQGRAAEVTKAWVVELLVAERATTAEQGLEVVKVRQAETEVAL